ncbi:PREDICTED: pentatricopeptide repeat-containing protein At5g39350-like [Camelina sativa]|uniref:Pentatricopeptide repeat-containing protein At5g39350-like n=1 Tax=Camelina sativa TaxID=90675 RepID=A0ABM1QPK9_CAMSA|nr:PREDICTED: pentatricopeptide repeat-containing protein At5g39350-like [Camelina sativa]
MSEVLRRAKHALSVKRYQSQSISKTKVLHCHIITGGRVSSHIVSTLSATYALCGHIAYARKLFEEMPERYLFSYSIVIRMYVRDGLYHDAVSVFIKMVGEGVKCVPDGYTYLSVVKAAGELRSMKLGLVMHGRILRSWYGADKCVQSALLAMYMNLGRIEMARMVFDVMQNRDVISWTTMISGYYRNGYMNDALMIFDWMVNEGVDPNHVTIVSMLPVCGHLKDLEMGRNVHKLVEEKRLGDKIEVKNALVNMYLKCNRMDEARFVFDRMEQRDVITWTCMINGYTEDGDVGNALELCRLMQFEGVRPNVVTVVSLVSACGDALKLNDGKCLHGWAIRQKVYSDIIMETSLISMYAKCNRIDLCFKVFSGASKNHTGPWNAIIAGCVQNELVRDALHLFKWMRRKDVETDIATLNSLLPAYATLAELRRAMTIHCYLTKTGFMSSLDAATGLVHVYSKCGTLESAHKIFNGIQEKHKSKDAVLCGALISGYGMHGDGHNALLVFMEIVRSGVTPRESTFTSALNACSHSGLVEEGLTLFRFMLENYKTVARSNHYTCIVDLLGRAGRLEEAYSVITTIPFEPTSAVWGALLAACVMHENVQLGEMAANKLFELEPENTGNYVLLANIYAAVGRWKDTEKVRKMMEDVGSRKKPGHSIIEMRSNSG